MHGIPRILSSFAASGNDDMFMKVGRTFFIIDVE